MLPTTVTDYLEKHRTQHLERLEELLRIPSIANVDDGACARAAEWLARRLESLGLRAELAGPAGRPNVLAEAHVRDDAPTLLIYGHYDVQPPDPLALWQTGPFDPVVRDGCLFARGSDDNKGQLFAQLMAIEAWTRAGGGPPVNLKVFLEGEEEIGSPSLEAFVAAHAERLAADAAVISDSGFFARGTASITYALRGLVYFEITARGPAADVHSGQHGGALANPINVLARLVAAMHDENGRITLPGFYDDVLEVGEQERRAWAVLPFDEGDYARSLGVDALSGGERGFSVLERRWARPTLDANGVVGGYTAAGSKTIIPAEARVKISARLVADQDPDKVAAGMAEFLAAHAPAGTSVSLQVHAKARPVLLPTDSPAMTAAKAALAEAFGQEPTLVRCGASVPVTELIQRLLGMDPVLMGFGLPDDNVHSPNEKFDLDQLWRGSIAAAAFLHNLRSALP